MLARRDTPWGGNPSSPWTSDESRLVKGLANRYHVQFGDFVQHRFIGCHPSASLDGKALESARRVDQVDVRADNHARADALRCRQHSPQPLRLGQIGTRHEFDHP